MRLLAPFDPVVWDRRRFELFWGWAYRFEAYTPAPKRKLGYYALPLLWRDRVIGWGNLSVKNGDLQADFRYVDEVPARSGCNFKAQKLAAEVGSDEDVPAAEGVNPTAYHEVTKGHEGREEMCSKRSSCSSWIFVPS